MVYGDMKPREVLIGFVCSLEETKMRLRRGDQDSRIRPSGQAREWTVGRHPLPAILLLILTDPLIGDPLHDVHQIAYVPVPGGPQTLI